MNDLTNEGVDRDHALSLQLPERNVNGPPIRAGIMEAVIGKIDKLTDPAEVSGRVAAVAERAEYPRDG